MYLLLLFSFIVRSVTFQGNVCNRTEFYRSFTGLREGVDISYPEIDKAVKSLISHNFASQVLVKVNKFNDTVDIFFRVYENPRVDSIIFEGTKKLKPQDIMKDKKKTEGTGENTEEKVVARFPLRRGDPVSDALLMDAVSFIKDRYTEKGYPYAEVTYSYKDRKGCITDVVFHVKEGPKARIKKIEIFGNKAFPDRKLIGKMKNKPRGFLRSGKLKREELKSDMERIEEYYKNRGYMNAKVDSFRVDRKGKDIIIRIYITEGKKYVAGSVRFTGNKVVDTRLLHALWVMRKGRVYSLKRIRKSLENIQGFYADSGYIYASLIPQDSIVKDTVNFIVYVNEGIRVRVRKVNIEGNTKTYDEVIRRELYLFPGEYFSRKMAIRSQRNLYYLNYFSNVMMDFSNTQDSSQIDVTFKVEEKSTGQLGLGATYSEIDGLSFYFQIQEPNFMGRGQTVGGIVEYGANRRNISLNYTVPWIGGKRRSFSGSIFYTTRYLPNYTEQKEGFSVGYRERIVSDYNYIGYGYSLDKTRLYDIPDELKSLPEYSEWTGGKPTVTSAISLSFTRDTRDRSFNAMSGERTSINLKLAGGPLFGDANFGKITVERSQLFNYKKKVILALRGFTGSVVGLKDANDVPFYERFFLGDVGAYGLRGYELRSVGPYENGYNVGGRVFMIGTVELRYRFSESMYGLLFFDAGNAWKNSSYMRPLVLKKGAGIGVRMEMPMLGIVGFDLAYGFDNNGGKWVPHIQFGTQF